MNICVFCSARSVAEKYVESAQEFASLIAKKNHTLVWGGSDNGLMKVVADKVKSGGGKIIGISVKLFESEARAYADEMVITKDLAERKETMLERSNALVVLPGGLGTLDELSEALEFKKDKLFRKVIVVLNTDGFYDGLRAQLKRMESEGFLTLPLRDLVCFVDTPDAAMRYINDYAD